MKKKKKKYYECTECGYVVDETQARCRCVQCDGAVLPYKDKLGVGVPYLIDGVVYLEKPKA